MVDNTVDAYNTGSASQPPPRRGGRREDVRGGRRMMKEWHSDTPVDLFIF
jgi:hypothetical protein